MTVITVGIALAVLFGIWAGKVDPLENPYYAFFGLAFPFLLVGYLVVFIYWISRKKWFFILPLLIILGYGYVPMQDSFGFWGEQGEAQKSDPAHLRVMTYNVHGFSAYGEKISEETLKQFFSLLQTNQPDIVCFQEYYTRNEGTYDTLDSLKAVLNTPYVYFEPTMSSGRHLSGLAIFSKFPIINTGIIEFYKSRGNSSIYADLKVDDKILRVYNVHLQSISFNREDYDYIDQVSVDMDQAQIDPAKRILRMLKIAFEKRSKQVAVMKAHMRESNIPYIIAGDFNDTPASYAVQQLTDSLNNAFEKKGWGLGRTYNGKFPNFQIDYIASTTDLEVQNYLIIKEKLSDHFPVRADFSWKSDLK